MRSRLFGRFREDKQPSRKPPTIQTATDAILQPPTDAADVALADDGMGSDALALYVDRNLNTQVWNGTTFADRMFHADQTMTRDLVGQMERSLLAQENYADFEARLLKSLGLDKAEPAGALRDLENRIVTENRIAWNRASVAAQGTDTDTALVWSSRLQEPDGKGHGTTPGCAWRHGRLLDELDDPTIPHHYGCECQANSIPNPNSADEDIAAEGQSIIDDMAAEREDWLSSYGTGDDEFAEAQRAPSRLFRFREAVSP